MKHLVCLGLLLVAIWTNQATANEQYQQIIQAVNRLSPDVKIEHVEEAPIPGWYQAIDGVNVFYVSADGHYVFVGALFDVENPDPYSRNLTENVSKKIRSQLLSSIPEDEMVVYKASGKQIGSVTVFTDIDCIYCQKFHQQIHEITKSGVEIRYLAFPRQGPGSIGFNKAVSIWCAADKNALMTLAKQRQSIETLSCSNNPVLKQFELGGIMGVRGTPTLVFEDGSLLSSYLPPEQLIQIVRMKSGSSQ